MKKENKTKEKEKKAAYSISNAAPEEPKKKLINIDSESGKFVAILLVIVAFLLLLWMVDILKNNKTEKEEETETSIQYEEVIVGNMLSQKYSEYFVFAYNEDENMKDLIDYLISLYKSKNTAVGSYTIDLDKAYNLPAVGTESNFKINTISDLKFKGTTVVKVKDGKIAEAIEGADEIIKYFRELNKAATN